MNPIPPLGASTPRAIPPPALPQVAPSPAAAMPPPPNPRLRLDPALGVVVMEFRNGSEEVQRSLPSEPELAAYRLAQRIGHKLDSSGDG